ncbi:hypothetical protein KIL84_005956 [Mauremys mutica]|uniref:Uncharacterized protein n=1 Tax=Mauremys mutica TaxID=74926 RepID=A0A9D3XHN3_9SAUR|nr:hypothetical protein KIL84_005956 [Mauremys mutica]
MPFLLSDRSTCPSAKARGAFGDRNLAMITGDLAKGHLSSRPQIAEQPHSHKPTTQNLNHYSSEAERLHQTGRWQPQLGPGEGMSFVADWPGSSSAARELCSGAELHVLGDRAKFAHQTSQLWEQ